MMTINIPGTNMIMYLQHGKTPLMVAAHFGHVDCVKMLLDRGAHANHKDKVSSYNS